MAGIVPDRFDSGGCLKILLIGRWSQLGENFFHILRCIERFLRRFARAQAFPIGPLVVRDLQSGRVRRIKPVISNVAGVP